MFLADKHPNWSSMPTGKTLGLSYCSPHWRSTQSAARKADSCMDPLVIFHCHQGVPLFPHPTSLHSHWVPPQFSYNYWPTLPHFFHSPHCCRTGHEGNDVPSLMKVTDEQSWANMAVHFQSSLLVTPPQSMRDRGHLAWMLSFDREELRLLKFCL